MQNPLNALRGLSDWAEIWDCDGVDEGAACSFASQLNQVSALAVAVAGCALCVDGQWAGAARKCACIGRERSGGRDDIGNAVARLSGRGIRLFDCVNLSLDDLAHQARVRRRALPTCAMPVGIGASPAAWAITSIQACTCRSMVSGTESPSISSGVQDARISTKDSAGRSDIDPNDAPDVTVIVPPT